MVWPWCEFRIYVSDEWMDGAAPSGMVGISASVNLPLHHKVQKFLFWHRLTRVVPEKGP